jgi:hypothetical protein
LKWCSATWVNKRRFFVAIDFSKYRGRYVAVVRGRVVASGTNAKRVWLQAKRKSPSARPELHKIPKGETLVLILCV